MIFDIITYVHEQIFFLYVYICMFIQDPRSMQDVLFKFIIQNLDIHLCAQIISHLSKMFMI